MVIKFAPSSSTDVSGSPSLAELEKICEMSAKMDKLAESAKDGPIPCEICRMKVGVGDARARSSILCGSTYLFFILPNGPMSGLGGKGGSPSYRQMRSGCAKIFN